MAKTWTFEQTDLSERDEWHLPNDEQQHVEQTVNPEDLMINPEDITTEVTQAPERSGIQYGWLAWNNQVEVAGGQWYVSGPVVQQDD